MRKCSTITPQIACFCIYSVLFSHIKDDVILIYFYFFLYHCLSITRSFSLSCRRVWWWTVRLPERHGGRVRWPPSSSPSSASLPSWAHRCASPTPCGRELTSCTNCVFVLMWLSLNFLLPFFHLSFTCSGTFLCRIKPSQSCGPFRGLNTMFQAGKKWVEALANDNPNLNWLTWVHTYLVENPFFLFLAAGIFLWVTPPFPVSFNKPHSK